LLKEKLATDKPRLLILSPSIGEFQECKTFVNRLSLEKKDHQMIFAFFSPSGYEQAKLPGAYDLRMMVPADTMRNARKLLNVIRPETVYILNSGIWPNLITALQQRNIPHYLISFFSRHKSSFYKPVLRTFYKPVFLSFHNIFCYNEEGKQLLLKYFGYSRSIVAGNLRFDAVVERKKHLRLIHGIETFMAGRFCVVAGSTEKKEDILLGKAFQLLRYLDIQWIIVPHEILPANISRLQHIFGDDLCLFSKHPDPAKKILLYDRVGDLFHLYSYANLCLVGRGFDRRQIHNMLEPAVFLKPVLFGPCHRKFIESRLFISQQLAFVYHDEDELAEKILQFYEDRIHVDPAAIQKIFDENSNGTNLVMKTILAEK